MRIVPILLTLTLGGCLPEPVRPAAPPEPRPANAAWVTLFDGNSLAGWRVVQGEARLEDGHMVLLGSPGHKCTVVAEELTMRDGTIEMLVCHDANCQNVGPYTVALRLKRSIEWSSVYCVSRPDTLEMCRGSTFNRQPCPQAQARYEMHDSPETWRFEMRGDEITCYRFGQKVLNYTDLEPAKGTVAITADGCRLRVISVRCLPADAPLPGRS